MKQIVQLKITEVYFPCPLYQFKRNDIKYKGVYIDVNNKIITNYFKHLGKTKLWVKRTIWMLKNDNVTIKLHYDLNDTISIGYKEDTIAEAKRFGEDKKVAVRVTFKNKNIRRIINPDSPKFRVINPKQYDSFRYPKYFNGARYGNVKMITVQNSSKEILEDEIEKVLREILIIDKRKGNDELYRKLCTKLAYLERKR